MGGGGAVISSVPLGKCPVLTIPAWSASLWQNPQKTMSGKVPDPVGEAGVGRLSACPVQDPRL